MHPAEMNNVTQYCCDGPYPETRVQIKTEPIVVPMSIFDFERGFVQADFQARRNFNINKLSGQIPYYPVAIEV